MMCCMCLIRNLDGNQRGVEPRPAPTSKALSESRARDSWEHGASPASGTSRHCAPSAVDPWPPTLSVPCRPNHPCLTGLVLAGDRHCLPQDRDIINSARSKTRLWRKDTRSYLPPRSRTTLPTHQNNTLPLEGTSRGIIALIAPSFALGNRVWRSQSNVKLHPPRSRQPARAHGCCVDLFPAGLRFLQGPVLTRFLMIPKCPVFLSDGLEKLAMSAFVSSAAHGEDGILLAVPHPRTAKCERCRQTPGTFVETSRRPIPALPGAAAEGSDIKANCVLQTYSSELRAGQHCYHTQASTQSEIRATIYGLMLACSGYQLVIRSACRRLQCRFDV
jgi:hypothetical protein